MTTGQRIRAARKKAGLTQEDLGKKLGVSGSFIAQYELNNRRPKLETLQRIAAALGTTVNWLLPPENYWEDENSAGNSAPMPEVTEQAMDKRLQDSYGVMTLEGKGKVVSYAEDILPRYKAQKAPPAPPEPPEGKGTPPPPDAPEGASEGE